MNFRVLFFDLDDTLYSSKNGLWEAIRQRIDEFLHNRLGFPPEQIGPIRQKYFESYGTTLRGLQIHHQVDPQEYLDFVHDVPLEQYLQPDPELHQMLSSLPQAKWIFTNADGSYARRVLEHLGVSDCFAGFIDVNTMGFAAKPQREAFETACVLAGEDDPTRCVLFDDQPRNLSQARTFGFFTVLVGREGHHPDAHRTVVRLHDLPRALPELWT